MDAVKSRQFPGLMIEPNHLTIQKQGLKFEKSSMWENEWLEIVQPEIYMREFPLHDRSLLLKYVRSSPAQVLTIAKL